MTENCEVRGMRKDCFDGHENNRSFSLRPTDLDKQLKDACVRKRKYKARITYRKKITIFHRGLRLERIKL